MVAQMMDKKEFDLICTAVDHKLGNPRMTWEGPLPHDFRNMEERGVRFVHSDLFSKPPQIERRIKFSTFGQLSLSKVPEGIDYAPEGKLFFKVLVGDAEAEAKIVSAITAAGYECQVQERGRRLHYPIVFEVAVNAALIQFAHALDYKIRSKAGGVDPLPAAK